MIVEGRVAGRGGVAIAKRKHGKSWAPVVADRARRRREFEELVAQALDDLPEEFARQMDNVAVVVEEEPEQDLLGLYQGIPQTSRDSGYTSALPDVITIYRGPIERRARTAEELARAARSGRGRW